MWEKNLKKNRYMYTYNWITLLYIWSKHIVKQLDSNKNTMGTVKIKGVNIKSPVHFLACTKHLLSACHPQSRPHPITRMTITGTTKTSRAPGIWQAVSKQCISGFPTTFGSRKRKCICCCCFGERQKKKKKTNCVSSLKDSQLVDTGLAAWGPGTFQFQYFNSILRTSELPR